MKGMWKIVLPVAVIGLALSACEQKTEIEAPAEAPAVEAPAEPVPEAAPVDPAMEAPADAPADGMAPAETKEGAPTP